MLYKNNSKQDFNKVAINSLRLILNKFLDLIFNDGNYIVF